jgi:hypothetical protein
MAQHKHMNGTRHARHFNGGKGHKVAGATGKVVSATSGRRTTSFRGKVLFDRSAGEGAGPRPLAFRTPGACLA